MIIGASVGLYLHCGIIRHLLHWIIVNILRGIIWTLHKTDNYYRPEPKPTPNKYAPLARSYKNQGIPTSEEALAKLFNNPDITIKGVAK
jgi:hypothetical protein